MKSLLILFVFTLTLISCGFGKLKVKLYNKTGKDIDSLWLCEKQLGQIKVNSFIQVDTCSSIDMQDNIPARFTAIIDNEPIYSGNKCGTPDSEITSGTHAFDFYIFSDTTRKYLRLKRHEEPKP